MTGLRTDGFDAMVAEAAALARKQLTASDAALVAATLDGRIDQATGLAALSRPERGVLEEMVRLGAGLERDVGAEDGNAEPGGWRLWLGPTGRLALRRGGEAVEGGHPIGRSRWPTRESLAEADRLAHQESWAQRAEFEEFAAELAGQSAEAVAQRLETVTYALVHLAPVRIYVGDRAYSNLGGRANLPGKSLAPGAPGSVLTALGRAPAATWPVEDAVFVACAAALIRSGTAVRLEEFNGRQLTPSGLAAWLCRKIREYGGSEADLDTTGIAGAALGRVDALALRCANLRARLLRSGAQFYRDIQGVNLYKEERRFEPTVAPSELPEDVVGFLREQAGLVPSADGAYRIPAELADALAGPSADARFGTDFERLLHSLLGTVAEATGADVTMARGPRCLTDLAAEHTSPDRILKLATNENYCCVVPSRAFRERFGEDRVSLVKALSSYGARMRYNTWHYLPDSMGLGRHLPGRDDWFFAPALPDITTWSDQHHTGHVMFGVRYAIRVPLGIHFDDAYRPGLYDLRLMRTGEPPFVLAQLRAGVAIGQVLAALHQAMAVHRRRIEAFDNAWFREFYG